MQHIALNSAPLICTRHATQRTSARAVGCFQLQAQHALTLAARTAGELRIAHGRVWLTFADAAQDAAVQAGDYFLNAGDVLAIAAGQQVVMEALDTITDEVYFSWEPAPAPSAGVSANAVTPNGINHQADVRQSLQDLALALHQAGLALGRLVQGVASGVVCSVTQRSRA